MMVQETTYITLGRDVGFFVLSDRESRLDGIKKLYCEIWFIWIVYKLYGSFNIESVLI
jgi:hypothetical protein